MDKWASGQVRQLMGSQVNELSDWSPASVKFARHITPLSPWRGVGVRPVGIEVSLVVLRQWVLRKQNKPPHYVLDVGTQCGGCMLCKSGVSV